MTCSSSAAAPSGAGGDTAPAGLADAEALRTAILACPDVVELSAGPFGEIASYFSGRRVAGVRIDEHTVQAHVVAAYGRPLPEITGALDAAVAGLIGDRTLQIVVTDLALPDEDLALTDER